MPWGLQACLCQCRRLCTAVAGHLAGRPAPPASKARQASDAGHVPGRAAGCFCRPRDRQLRFTPHPRHRPRVAPAVNAPAAQTWSVRSPARLRRSCALAACPESCSVALLAMVAPKVLASTTVTCGQGQSTWWGPAAPGQSAKLGGCVWQARGATTWRRLMDDNQADG